MWKRALPWIASVLAAVALSTVILVTLMGLSATQARHNEDVVVCVATNRTSSGVVGLLNDLLADPRTSPSLREHVLAAAQHRFPQLDCTRQPIRFATDPPGSSTTTTTTVK